MVRSQSGGRTGVFVVLIVYIVVLSGAQIPTSQGGVVRLGGFSLLAPLVASALLPYRRALIICGLTLLALVVLYSGVIPGLPGVHRMVTIALVALGTAASILVLRIRLAHEERIKGLMIARDRLSLLTAAGEQVGSTLDVTRTAQELADVAVPRFASAAAVDLFGTILSGDEPPALPAAEPVTVQRVACSGGPHPPSDPGSGFGLGTSDMHTYAPGSLPGGALLSGRPVRGTVTDFDAVDGRFSGTGTRTTRLGGGSALVVPLRARGITLGVATFVRAAGRVPFDADDLLLAEEIGTRSAVCVDNARRYAREHLTALALQHSLLPSGLPEQSAVVAAHRYLPAQVGVGGDWYDVIPLSGARVALVVGDVMGHGVHAAATMGRLRTAVHNYAALDLPPEDLLTNLDDLVKRLGLDEYIATCLYTVYDPVARRCTLARAGHPPPALVLPDGSVTFPDVPAGPPLGVGGVPFEAVEIPVPEGSRLVLYTDGLIEARDRDIDTGMEALRQALENAPDRSPEETCQTVMATMPDTRTKDDVALLVVRTLGLPGDQCTSWDIPSDPAAVSAVRERALKQLEEWELTEYEFSTELIISELVTNAIRYGGTPISLRLLRDDNALICEVSDGSSTSPRLRRAGAADEGGRGLFLVAQLSQRWGTRYTPNGKIIWTEQRLAASLVPA
ncbi:SpoIIE family protein phosphatase [Streptomyces sp. NPDC056716]|uniref:ATP-binding SpoIIE family protein phosphatase n=1 Tax=unclassified Streptomyces TaxID=2593676 RepID=UPI0036900D92